MTIRIERIEIVLPLDGRTGTVMAQRVETANGRTSYIEPIDLKIGFDGSELPIEVQNALTTIDAQQQARIAELESQLSAMTAERDSLATDKAALTTERDSLQLQVSDLQNDLTEATTRLATATSQVDALTSQRDSAIEQVATLQSRINELTAEPDTPIVSRRQARLALLQMGYFNQVEAAVYGGPLGVRIEYEADMWRRDNPTLIAMAEQLGMDEAAINQFFQLAGTL